MNGGSTVIFQTDCIYILYIFLFIGMCSVSMVKFISVDGELHLDHT